MLKRSHSKYFALFCFAFSGCLITDRNLVQTGGPEFPLTNQGIEVSGLSALYHGEYAKTAMVSLDFESQDRTSKIALQGFEISIHFAGQPAPAPIEGFRLFTPYSENKTGPCPCDIQSEGNEIGIYTYFHPPTRLISGQELKFDLKADVIVDDKPVHAVRTEQRRRLEIKRYFVFTLVNPAGW